MTTKIFAYLHKHARQVKRIFLATLALTVIFDFFIERSEAHFLGDRIYGFWSMFGLACCLGMIFFCKWLAHAWLMKDEDYYDN